MNSHNIIRILVIDDQESIHEDFRKIIASEPDDEAFHKAATALFGGKPISTESGESFEIDSAYQGEDGLAMVRRAVWEGRPYPLAFVDIRMPPGWDGVETVEHIWKVDPEILIVLCTAYSDHSWEDIVRRLGRSDHLLILKKPFDNMEVRQLVLALTKRWQLARQAAMTLTQLEQMVAQRTREVETRSKALEKAAAELRIMNEQLASAQVAAEAANQAKSEFLANMSHEIRTPMTSILGFAELLSDDVAHLPKPNMNAEYVEAIMRNARYLLGVISDILDMSKIESGKFEVKRVKCSPSEIIENARMIMQSTIEEKGLSFSLEHSGDIPPFIYTDPVRLQQILINLLSNAVKFTPSGKIRLTAEYLRDDPARPLLCLRVIDTGIGISADKINKLFDRFTQADTSSTRKYGGSGLGLAISRRLANMLGGDIMVESKPGQGSTFMITVETETSGTDASAEDRQAAQQVEQSHKIATEISAGKQILLIEDSKDNQRITSLILGKAGFQVTIAENGRIGCEKALDAFNAGRPYDLVLMDMQMPVMDGYEATHRLRDAGYNCPIVALTAHATTHDRQKCLEAGCNHYVSKPINRDELLLVIKDCIRLSQESQQPGEEPASPAPTANL